METVERVVDLVMKHWAFLAAVVVFGLVGTVMNKRVFTDAQARMKRSSQWIWWWGRKTLPLHPVVTGLALGFFWKMPEPGVDTVVEQCGYFGMAGAVSVFAYEVVKGLLKKRGIDIDLPGGTPVPPKPEDTRG